MRFFAVRRKASSPHVDGYAFDTYWHGTVVIWMDPDKQPSRHADHYQDNDAFVKATAGMELREIMFDLPPSWVVECALMFMRTVEIYCPSVDKKAASEAYLHFRRIYDRNA